MKPKRYRMRIVRTYYAEMEVTARDADHARQQVMELGAHELMVDDEDTHIRDETIVLDVSRI